MPVRKPQRLSNSERIQQGSGLVQKTHEAFEQVAGGSSKISELVGNIASASREQSLGIEQVNVAVAEVEKVTQQNAASSEKSASASQELMPLAQQVQAFVAELESTVLGRHQHTSASYEAGSGPMAGSGDITPARNAYSNAEEGTQVFASAPAAGAETMILFDDDEDQF